MRCLLARAERLADKEVLQQRQPGKGAEALADARRAAREHARRKLERELATSPNPVLRAAYERVLFGKLARETIGPTAREMKRRFQRLRLARPGGWRKAPFQDVPTSRARTTRAKSSRRVG